MNALNWLPVSMVCFSCVFPVTSGVGGWDNWMRWGKKDERGKSL